ncbi:alpha/beta hydrolase [Pendulispora albinea]|uniref:Lysophospholipase n=1 Tax=Pendulispora albinea TaxID=2741071 RepID=A0ABZ2LV23_9BACT
MRTARGMRLFLRCMVAVAIAALVVFAGAAAGADGVAAGADGAAAGADHTPADGPGVSHESGFFAGTGGVKLFEQSWRVRGRPRAVVVIHHGLKSHSEHDAELSRRLVAQGYDVHAYDMRGHGRSEGRRATIDDFDDLLGDLALFLARVRAREPGLPIFLLGHSVGGAVVTLFALERHPPLAGVVLLAPALRVDKPLLLAAATPLSASLLPNFPAIDIPDGSFSRDPQTVANLARDPLVEHSPAPARTARALLRAIERIWARAGTFDLPLLALHGTGDHVTDPRGTAEIVARARTSPERKTLLLYGGLYHDLLHEPERAQVMDDVIAWLNAAQERVPSARPDRF